MSLRNVLKCFSPKVDIKTFLSGVVSFQSQDPNSTDLHLSYSLNNCDTTKLKRFWIRRSVCTKVMGTNEE